VRAGYLPPSPTSRHQRADLSRPEYGRYTSRVPIPPSTARRSSSSVWSADPPGSRPLPVATGRLDVVDGRPKPPLPGALGTGWALHLPSTSGPDHCLRPPGRLAGLHRVLDDNPVACGSEPSRSSCGRANHRPLVL